MLLTSERVSPWRARCMRSSLGRSTSSTAPSWRTVMSGGNERDSEPRGPLTVISRPPRATSTPDGMLIGDRPTRDIRSPHVTEDLAADAALARLAVGHEALAGGQDGDAEAAEHAGEPVGLDVHAQTRLRHPAQSRDARHALRRVLHRHLERATRTRRVVVHLVARDVALALEDGGQRLLELRRGHAHEVVLGHVGVAQ